jgi:CxxC-x17-CxxC domain-containing protein
MYEDEKLICEECGSEFIFSAGEQEFYAEKGLTNKPKRCTECRKARKQNKKRKLFDAVCSNCGTETKVPFKPIEGKDVFCQECFKKSEDK